MAGREIGRLLRAAHPGLEMREQIIVTAGDRMQTGPVLDIGGKGVWVEEIEEALSERRVDLAVHSMKDVPAGLAPGLGIVAMPPRADPRDAHRQPVGRRDWRPAAGQPRRHLQPAAGLSASGGACPISRGLLRGNVDTRLRKVAEGVVDAAVLACAGLDRLGFGARITERLEPERCCPRSVRARWRSRRALTTPRVVALCRALSDPAAEITVAAERALLAGLGVGCRTPVARVTPPSPMAGSPSLAWWAVPMRQR